MNAQAIAIHFADELCRTRALTSEESDMLCSIVRSTERNRTSWTLADTRQLRKLMAKGCTRKEIAQTMERSCFTIDKRMRRVRARAEVSRG